MDPQTPPEKAFKGGPNTYSRGIWKIRDMEKGGQTGKKEWRESGKFPYMVIVYIYTPDKLTGAKKSPNLTGAKKHILE